MEGAAHELPDPEDNAVPVSPERLGGPACAGPAPQKAVRGWSGSAVLEGLFHGVMRVADNPEGYGAYLECRPHWCSAEAAATQSRKSEYTGTPLASIISVTFWVYGPPFPPTRMGFLAAAENSAR